MIVNGTVSSSDMLDGAALAELLDDDGSGSGLDADQLDGQHGSAYRNASNINSGNLNTLYFSALSDLGAEGYLGNDTGDLAQNNGTLQTNLNADLLDGQHGSAYLNASNINTGTLSTLYYSALSDLGAEGYLGNDTSDLAQNNGLLQTNLNADLLDGQHGSAYLNASNINAGTLNSNYYSAITDLGAEGYLDNGSGDLAQNNGTLQTNLNADMLDGQHGSFYQARVSGECSVGSTVRAINANGTVTCQTDAPLNRISPPRANTFTTLDNSGNVGWDTSITIGVDGLGLISYFDSTNKNLMVAHCEDTDCTSAISSTNDSSGSVGLYNSITIGADGLGLISYYDNTNDDLKVAHCEDTDCTSVISSTLDSGGDVGSNTSITIGADGLGLISYYDDDSLDLKVAHCSNITCTSANITTLNSGVDDVGYNNSITIGADGLGLISYYDYSWSNGDLKVAHCDNTDCTSATITILDSDGIVGGFNSITIGMDGLGLISYKDSTNNSLKVAHCSNTNCTSATTSTLDSTGSVGQTSITIGADGLGLVSYLVYDNYDLKVAHCSNTNCTSATITTLDSSGAVGLYTSITIGADGLGLISYYDDTSDDLKVAHCANAFCTPYFRRR